MTTFTEETSLLSLLPRIYKDSDEDGSLQAFFTAVDELWSAFSATASSMDRAILDPSDDMLDAWLEHRACPFHFMDYSQKKKFAEVMVQVYQLRGSEDGLINLIHYLLGITVSIVYDYEESWLLGVNLLGVDTYLIDTKRPYMKLYAPADLTNDQKTAIMAMVDFMKPHWLRVAYDGWFPPIILVAPSLVNPETEFDVYVKNTVAGMYFTWTFENCEQVNTQILDNMNSKITVRFTPVIEATDILLCRADTILRYSIRQPTALFYRTTGGGSSGIRKQDLVASALGEDVQYCLADDLNNCTLTVGGTYVYKYVGTQADEPYVQRLPVSAVDNTVAWETVVTKAQIIAACTACSAEHVGVNTSSGLIDIRALASETDELYLLVEFINADGEGNSTFFFLHGTSGSSLSGVYIPQNESLTMGSGGYDFYFAGAKQTIPTAVFTSFSLLYWDGTSIVAVDVPAGMRYWDGTSLVAVDAPAGTEGYPPNVAICSDKTTIYFSYTTNSSSPIGYSSVFKYSNGAWSACTMPQLDSQDYLGTVIGIDSKDNIILQAKYRVFNGEGYTNINGTCIWDKADSYKVGVSGESSESGRFYTHMGSTSVVKYGSHNTQFQSPLSRVLELSNGQYLGVLAVVTAN